jgi:Domain of unknown function (DUF4337)
MGSAHEVAEQIEHAAHAGHGGDGHGHATSGKYIGLTMAILGVMLAVCSALVGAERTELIRTMVEQSNAFNDYQATSTKYRMLVSDMQQLYAQTPSRRLTEEALGRLDQVPVPPEQQGVAAIEKATLKELMALLQPRKTEVEAFMATLDHYKEERLAAKAWAESYEDAVRAHFEGSEQFEKAQLTAEIGIVIASIALLLANRRFWYVSIVAAIVCAGLIGVTWARTHQALHAAEERIEHAKEHDQELRFKKDAQGRRLADVRDDELVDKIRERFGLAAAAPAPEHPAAEHH